MSLAACTEAIRGKVGEDSGLDATLKFDTGGDGVIHVDAARVPNVVSNDDLPADCTIRIALSDLEALLAGTLEPTGAFMMGKIGVEGDMSVAMRLQQVV